jgi:hypothetical protein
MPEFTPYGYGRANPAMAPKKATPDHQHAAMK